MIKQLDFEDSHSASNQDLIVLGLMVLVKTAKIDGIMSSDELSHIVGGMFTHFETEDSTVGELLEVANFLANDSTKEQCLLERVRNEFSLEQRMKIMTIVWRVIASDNKVASQESQYAQRIRNSLGLSLEQGVLASKKAEEEVKAYRARKASQSEDEESGEDE